MYEGFVDQHLLLAEAGVDPLVGLERPFRNLGKTHQIGTSEFFTHQVSSLVDGFWRVVDREHAMEADEEAAGGGGKDDHDNGGDGGAGDGDSSDGGAGGDGGDHSTE